ncbi:MAG: hypothetical protein ACYC3Q_11770 [Gemmatimonadaceae bacterium]
MSRRLRSLAIAVALAIGPRDGAGQSAPAVDSRPRDDAPTPPWAMAGQLLVELQYSVSALDRGSPLNPQNVARIPAAELESRLFPQLVLRHRDAPLLRGEARVRARRAAGDSTAGDVEIQELFLGRALTPAWYVAVGRQRLGWGTAFGANPTRLEAQRDAFRIANRLRGADVARVEWLHGDWAANAVLAPARHPAHTLAALRLERTLGEAALSATLTTRAGRDWRLGGDVARPAGSATWYAEGTLSGWAERPEWSFAGGGEGTATASPAGSVPRIRHGRFTDLVGGVAWLPSPSVRVVTEYRYQSDYASRAQFDRFVASLPRDQARYDPLGQGRHRLFSSLRLGDPRRIAATVAAYTDPVTRQLLLMPGIEHGGDHLQLEVTSLSFLQSQRVAALRHRTFAVLSVFF